VTGFGQFTFDTAFTPGIIHLSSIENVPENASVTADYRIIFSSENEVPVNGKINIKFPGENFTTLPNPPQCLVSGALESLKACSLEVNLVSLELNTRYSSGDVVLVIKGIENFAEGTSQNFVITATYDEVVLAQTDASESLSSVFTVSTIFAPVQLTVEKFDFTPENESELAVYSVKFKSPSSPILTTQEILLGFPSVYDNYLGDNVYCITNLPGDETCVVDYRKIVVSGHFEIAAGTSIEISVLNIRNPKFTSNQSTGQFFLATRIDNIYYHYNGSVGSFAISSGPDFTNLSYIVQKLPFSRERNDFYMLLTPNKPIPPVSDSGEVHFMFPTGYSFDPRYPVKCETNDTFSTAPKCTVKNETTVVMTGNTSNYSKELEVWVRDVINPIEVTNTVNIQVSVYDGSTDKLLERSFNNLSPNTFPYSYFGPVIAINGDKTLYIESGTRKTVTIEFEYPCYSDLTLTAYSDVVEVIPPSQIIKTGQKSGTFTISVDNAVTPDTYSIYWDQSNDLNERFYARLAPLRLQVVKKQDVKITFESVIPVPRRGSSLPTTVSLELAPNTGLRVNIKVTDNDNGALTVEPAILRFDDNSITKTFEVLATKDASIGTHSLEFSFEGEDAQAYNLNQPTTKFSVISEDTSNPSVIRVDSQNIERTSFELIIETSEPGIVYYGVAYSGTPEPSFHELKVGGPSAYYGSNARYFSTPVGVSNQVTVKVTDLEAQVEYVIYAVMVDRSGNEDTTPISLVQKTQDRYNAIDFSLRFAETRLYDAEIEVVRRRVSEILSLPLEKVTQPVTLSAASSSSSSRRLDVVSTDGSSVILDMQIHPSPFSDVLPSPRDMITRLNEQKAYLDKHLSNFDTAYVIPVNESDNVRPSWVDLPVIETITKSTLTVTAKSSTKGYIYAAILTVETDTEKPRTWQLWKKFNSKNSPLTTHQVIETAGNVKETLEFADLKAGTNYFVTLAAGGVYPSYPVLMNDDEVRLLSFTTSQDTNTVILNASGSQKLCLSLSILIIFTFYAILDLLVN